MGRKSKFILACLDCGDEFSAKDELMPCPECGGAGELSVSNYEDSEYDTNLSNDEDIDLDNLVYDPSLFD